MIERREQPQRDRRRPRQDEEKPGGAYSLTGECLDEPNGHQRSSRAEMEELFTEQRRGERRRS